MEPIGPVGFWSLVAILAINSVFVAVIAVAFWLINQRLAQIERRLPPLIERTTAILAQAERLTEQIHQRTERILDTTTRVVDTVSQRVDTTTALAEEAISQPLIGAASVMAGVSRAVRTYREHAEKGDGR
ncbi:MAG: hypothetical protein HY320_08530 [Armatimonadetes bacterium]|nr:hypothetical protein [Armatimonadota bacterium]